VYTESQERLVVGVNDKKSHRTALILSLVSKTPVENPAQATSTGYPMSPLRTLDYFTEGALEDG